MPGNFADVPNNWPAEWPAPHYKHPRVRRGWLPAFSCTLLAFSTVLVAGRFYLRGRKQAGVFGLDDLFIGLAWLVSIGFSTSAVIDSEWYSVDVHTWDVPVEEWPGAALMGFIAQILFLVSTCATKASVLLFYRRMAKDTYSRTWLYATWGALAFTAAYFIGILLAYCLMCTPIEAYWLSYDPSYDKPHTCLNGNVLSPLVGVLSVISDIYAVLLPCIWLHRYNLHVTRRQRIALDIVFALGMIVAGCGMARTYYLWKINHTIDTSWTGFSLFTWSLLECHLAIIFACAPSLRAFIRRYLADTFTSTFKSGSQSTGKSGTTGSSRDASRAYSSDKAADVEIGKDEDMIEQRVLTMPSHDEMDPRSDSMSTRSRSSEAVPTIRTAEDYEAYNLKQLSRYGAKETFTSYNATAPLSEPPQAYYGR